MNELCRIFEIQLELACITKPIPQSAEKAAHFMQSIEQIFSDSDERMVNAEYGAELLGFGASDWGLRHCYSDEKFRVKRH